MTVGVSDGERLYAARYASDQEANSLYVTNDVQDVRELYPEETRFRHLGDEARAVVSEPLGELPGVWREVPPGSALIVQPGADEEVPFRPQPYATPASISSRQISPWSTTSTPSFSALAVLLAPTLAPHDQHVGVGRDRRGGRRAGALAQALERRAAGPSRRCAGRRSCR